MSVEPNFDELEKAFPKMTEEETEIITAVHPLLDGDSFSKGADLLGMSESKFMNCLDRLFIRFPALKKEVLRKGRSRKEETTNPVWSGRDEKMEEFAKALDLDPMEYEFIKLVHPIFDVDMTRKQACETLGWSVPTGIRIWNSLLERFPELEESMEKWVNPEGVSRHSLENPMRFADLDDPFFGEDTIVRKF